MIYTGPSAFCLPPTPSHMICDSRLRVVGQFERSFGRGSLTVTVRGGATGYELGQAVARRRVMKLAHSSRLTIRTGPSGFLESRTATMPGRLRATSTQLAPPLP